MRGLLVYAFNRAAQKKEGRLISRVPPTEPNAHYGCGIILHINCMACVHPSTSNRFARNEHFPAFRGCRGPESTSKGTRVPGTYVTRTTGSNEGFEGTGGHTDIHPASQRASQPGRHTDRHMYRHKIKHERTNNPLPLQRPQL